MKKLIISDFFGVVGDEDSPVFFAKYVSKEKAHDLTAKYFHPGDRGEVTFEGIIDNVSKDLMFDKNFLREEFLNTPKPKNEYINLLGKLKDEGHVVVLLSNACDFLVPYLIKKYGIQDLFDRTYISSEIGHFKPNKDAFEYVLEKENTDANDAMFIDDNPSNCKAAENVNIESIIFKEDAKTLQAIYDLACK